MQVEQSFFTGVQDVGENNEITNKAILEALTNVTNVHGHRVGQSTGDENYVHLAWMVLNWKLQVIRRPKVCETFTARTWAQECSKVFAARDFEVLDGTGVVCARATSKWTAADHVKGTLVKLTSDIMDAYGCEPEHRNFPGFKFANLAHKNIPALSTTTFKITKSMIDCNDHVHNPAYLDLACEALPEGLDRRHFDNVEVAYRKEIAPHATVLLHYGEEDGKHYVFIKDESDSLVHAVVVLF